MSIRREMAWSYLVCFACFLSTGCASHPQPRVIADRIFPKNKLQAIITTYPGDPQNDLMVVSAKAKGIRESLEMKYAPVEGQRTWRLHCIAPEHTRRWTLRVIVSYVGRQYRVDLPFRYRKVFVAHQGRSVYRWTAGRERIHDLGPAKDVPHQAVAEMTTKQ